MTGWVADGGEGRIEVHTEWRTVYDAQGAIVLVERAPLDEVAPAPAALVAGPTVAVSDTCTLELPGLRRPAQVLRSATHAVVADGSLLVVDLGRCVPVAALGGIDLEGSLLLQQDLPGGPALADVDTKGGAVRVRRWRLHDLLPLPGFDLVAQDLLAGSAGPTLVTWRSGLRTPSGPVELPGSFTLVGDGVLWVDPQGALSLLDGDGRVVERTGPGLLSGVSHVDAAGGAWWVSDAETTVGLPGGEPTPFDVNTGPDEPEVKDELSGSSRTAPDLALYPSDRDRCVARPRAFGLLVTCDGLERGRVPVWTERARVTPDAAVLVAFEADSVSAWSVATGELLWRVDEPQPGSRVALGPDWVAVSVSLGWRFLDPVDGHLIGDLRPDGTFEADGTRVRFGADLTRGRPWSAPPPPIGGPFERLPPPFTFTPDVAGTECSEQAADLAPLSRWPELYNVERERLSRLCRGRAHADIVEPWPATATRARGADWVWDPSGAITRVEALGEGRVLVEGNGQIGVLGPDGALLWTRPAKLGTYAVPGVVVGVGFGRSVGWDVATGEVRWSQLGGVHSEGRGWVVHPIDHGPLSPFDVATGQVLPGAPLIEGRAMGLVCSGGTCRPEEPDAEVDRWSTRSGDQRWWIDQRLGAVLARGVLPPAAEAHPLREVRAVRTSEAPPELPVPVGPLREARAATPVGAWSWDRVGVDLVATEGGAVRWRLRVGKEPEEAEESTAEGAPPDVEVTGGLVVVRRYRWVYGFDPFTGELVDVIVNDRPPPLTGKP